MIDLFIFIIFLIFLFFASWKSFSQIDGINSFSVGTKSISITTLAMTIAATWSSGSGFILDLNEFHKNGISYFIEALAMCITLTLVAIYIAPKMQDHLRKTTIASIMGDLYGQKVRTVTAIVGVISASGGIYIQFKIMGYILNYFVPVIPLFWCTVISASIVIFYTFMGGVNSVVYTDKIQTICFLLSLVIGIVIFKYTISTNTPIDPNMYKHYHPSYFFTFNKKQWFDFLCMFGYFLIPSMAPQVTQRVCMGINIRQVKYAYLTSALILFVVLVLSCYFSFLLFQVKPDTPKDGALTTLLSLYSIDGTKAILVIGILCMCMSTADSQLNISAVLIGNDLIHTQKSDKLKKLKIARISTIFIGLLSLVFSMSNFSLITIITFSMSFYMPVVTVPFLVALHKKKITERCCLFSMFFSLVFVIAWKIYYDLEAVIIPIAMLINFLLLMSFHYIVEKWEWLKPIGITSQLKKE